MTGMLSKPPSVSWGSRVLDFSKKTFVMGILNCTPDSFYPDSRKVSVDEAVRGAKDMIDSGVDIIDIGGESSRPGAEPVSEEREAERVCPVIRGIRDASLNASEVLISVDTVKPKVADQAIEAGADMINDISGMRCDKDMGRVAVERNVPIILMHIRGTPRTMQKNPFYEDTIEEIKSELSECVSIAESAGVQRERIILDPGIGFGKRVVDNLIIIRDLERLKELGMPLLIGLSRKSFLESILGLPVEERLIGTVAANTIAVLNGADIVRVHDYREGVQMARVIDAVRKKGAAY